MEQVFREYQLCTQHSPQGAFFESYESEMCSEGYAQQTIEVQIRVVADFSHWLARRRISAQEVTAELLRPFLRARARRRCPTRNDQSALDRLLSLLIREGVVPPPTSPAATPAEQAQVAWEQLQAQFAALQLVVNQEKSRLTTLTEGFAFLGFEFRKAPRRMLYMWPREKACNHIRQRVREVVRSFPPDVQVGVVIQKLNPMLNGCTYFRVGNSNRTFHRVNGLSEANCSYGFGASIGAPGGLLRNDGDITFFMADVGCIAW